MVSEEGDSIAPARREVQPARSIEPMTLKELRKIRAIMNESDFDTFDNDWEELLLGLINQHVAEVIGEDDYVHKPVINRPQEEANLISVGRNLLREEQRKRAGL